MYDPVNPAFLKLPPPHQIYVPLRGWYDLGEIVIQTPYVMLTSRINNL